MTQILSIITFLALLFYTATEVKFQLQMMQQNTYRNDRYNRWLKGESFASVSRLVDLFLLLLLSTNFLPLFVQIVVITAALYKSVNHLKAKYKKPLVFTRRAIRLYVAALLALAILAPYLMMAANWLMQPVEKQINRKYYNEAKQILAQMPGLTVIGITGSYGKTSVKYYLNTLLKARYNVLMTPESFNTPMGVVKTVRGSLRATHEIFICEMGAKYVGEIKELCDIVHPKHGIITSIGPQHLETFKSLDNVISTKFELADALPQDGMLFLNGDNEYTAARAKDGITYGLNSDSDYKAKVISVSEKGTTFEVTAPDGETGEFSTKLIGVHNCLNILGAIAVSHELGIPLKELRPQVRRLENVPHRLELSNRGGMTVIDDSYNSNPSGTKAALEALSLFEGEKILVTPGMVELGDKQDEYNREFGRNAAAVCNYVALVGERQTKSIYDGLVSAGFDKEKIFVAPNIQQALAWVGGIRTPEKKTVLLENDLPDNY